MKKISITLFLISCIANLVFGQVNEKLLYKSPTNAIDSVFCQGNNQAQYKKLQVFTTHNNKWTGIKDTLCYKLVEPSTTWIDYSVEIDKSYNDKYIFVVDSAVNIPLEKDSVYKLRENTWRKNCRVREFVVFMLVEKFDTSLNNYRIDTVNITNKYEYCLCGNKFDGKIRAFVIGIKPYDITSGASIYAEYQILRQQNPFVISDSLTARKINDSIYIYDNQQNNWLPRNIVFSNPNSDPFNTAINTIEIHPAGEPNKKVKIIYNTWGYGIFFQPYTELRGSVYDTITGNRHQLEIDLFETNICITPIVELVIDDDNILKYTSGKLALNGKNACTMIKDQATLLIAEESHLEYGIDGEGILGFRPGAKLILEKNAKITINNMLLLADYWDKLDGGEIDLILQKGNELNFGKYATVSNGPFAHGSVVMNIYVKGGKLDISHLDAESLSLLNIIYEETNNENLPELAQAQAFPNPAARFVNLSFKAESSILSKWQLISLSGEILEEGEILVSQNNNMHSFDLGINRQGLYFLRINYAGHWYTKKVVLVNLSK